MSGEEDAPTEPLTTSPVPGSASRFVFGSQAADNAAWEAVRAAVLAGLDHADPDVDKITSAVVPVLVRLADQARADGERTVHARIREVVRGVQHQANANLAEAQAEAAVVATDWVLAACERGDLALKVGAVVTGPGIPGGAEVGAPKPDAATMQRLLSAMGLPPKDTRRDYRDGVAERVRRECAEELRGLCAEELRGLSSRLHVGPVTDLMLLADRWSTPDPGDPS